MTEAGAGYTKSEAVDDRAPKILYGVRCKQGPCQIRAALHASLKFSVQLVAPLF